MPNEPQNLSEYNYYTVTVPESRTVTTPSPNNYYGWTEPYPYDVTWPNYSWITNSYPTIIYKYQIKCPRCKTFNWLELDKITECASISCKARLKAVSEKVDYEVPITVGAAA